MIRRLSACLLIICMMPLLSGRAAGQTEGLVPVGQTVGLEIGMDGVYVVKFESEDGTAPAEAAGLKVGDRILSVDGEPVQEAETLRLRVAASRGEQMRFLVGRGEKTMSFSVQPEAEAGSWRIGVYVRDRIRGLGTVTFYDPDTGVFGALGHGVGDGGPGQPLGMGLATETEIVSVRMGRVGTPGALQGSCQAGRCLGLVEENTPQGIFGRTEAPVWAGQRLPVATQEQVCTGPAEIWCNVEGGEVRRYQAEIEGLSFGSEPCKNLRIRVTDPELLEKTGGIVQGMSGSPIIQNGRLVGAVTHVLIRDPARGYGILLENMLEASELWQQALPEAA